MAKEPVVLNIPDPTFENLQVPEVEDLQAQKYIIPLDGQMILSQDPAQIGKNFQQLQNLRYRENYVEGILGMTKINSSAITTYKKVRNAIHLDVADSNESHLVMQAKNTAESASGIIDFTTAPPATGSITDTLLYTDTSASADGFFSLAPGGNVVYCNGTKTCIWGGTEIFTSAFITSTAAVTHTATEPRDYSEVINNDSSDTANVASITKVFLVGSLRPLQGVKVYVKTGNSSNSTMTGKVWNGANWVSMTITDGTSASSKSLNKTGSITFSSTVTSAAPKYLEGYLLYWYQFEISAGSAVIYKVTLDAPFQEIVDIWDGYERFCASFYLYKAAYFDYWLNVYQEQYYSSDNSTYVNVGALTSAQQILVGFPERISGISFAIAPDYANTVAATAMSVKYWNGAAFSSISTISDGTSEGGISLNRSGVVYWTQSGLNDETRRVIKGGYPLYYYEFSFSKTLSTNVRIYYVSGIPAQKQILGYSFPVHAADRLMLLGNTGEYPNKILISAEQAPQVMNGENCFEIYIGDDKRITGGAPMFAQFASNLYNMVILFKENQTWMLTWVNSSAGTIWERYMISDTVGCPAPNTIRTTSVSFENNINQTRNIAIWQSHDGVYMSDGRTPLLISADIETVFDQAETTHINLAMINKSYGFLDKRRNEYHWLWASGSNTTLDKEYVLDLKRWRWFEIDRGTGMQLQCGVSVMDAYGNAYDYGFIDTGFMERLENGTTFDGNDIEHILHTGDQILVENDFFTQTRVEKVVMIAKSRNTDTSATVTNYLDTSAAGDDHIIDVSGSDRLARVVQNVHSDPAIFHSFKLEMATNDETKGFVPLFLGAYYTPERDDGG